MFGIKKKPASNFEVLAPITGKCIPLASVQDNVFAKKMMGEGFAIIPDKQANQVVSPITGEIVLLPESKHAIGIKSEIYDLSVMVHIGLNTVELNGSGFTPQVKLNQKVNAGDPIMQFDIKTMKEREVDMTTMVIFTDGYEEPIELNQKVNQSVSAGTPILKQA